MTYTFASHMPDGDYPTDERCLNWLQCGNNTDGGDDLCTWCLRLAEQDAEDRRLKAQSGGMRQCVGCDIDLLNDEICFCAGCNAGMRVR